jgi:release factor glutamine methyltransferase
VTHKTAAAAVRAAARRLLEADIASPLWEARHLLCDAEGLTPEDLLLDPDRPLSDPDRFEAWVARRAAGEPLARITGQRSFRGLTFHIGPDTLDPRADSEVVVDAALALLPEDRPARIADLGTGSGCLLLAVLHERPRAAGIGLDLSAGAARMARQNAQYLGLADRAVFARGHWSAALAPGSLDLLIANPPYIRRAALGGLEAAVRDFDPVLALDGGADGLDAYRSILPDAARCLKPGGALVLEIGWDQAESVSALAAQAGFGALSVGKDLAGRPRAVTARNATKKNLE